MPKHAQCMSKHAQRMSKHAQCIARKRASRKGVTCSTSMSMHVCNGELINFDADMHAQNKAIVFEYQQQLIQRQCVNEVAQCRRAVLRCSAAAQCCSRRARVRKGLGLGRA